MELINDTLMSCGSLTKKDLPKISTPAKIHRGDDLKRI